MNSSKASTLDNFISVVTIHCSRSYLMPVDFVSYLLKILNYHNYTHTCLLLQSGYSCYTFSALCKVTWIMGCNGSQKRFFCVPFGKTKLKLSSHSPLPSSRPLNHPWGYHSHSICCLCVCVSEWAHSVFQICEILPLRVCVPLRDFPVCYFGQDGGWGAGIGEVCVACHVQRVTRRWPSKVF